MNIKDIQPGEYAPYAGNYLAQVDDTYSLVEELEISVHNFIRFVQNIPMDKIEYRYAEGKWTIKDIIQHVIDTERIFAYRALRFARNDKTELPGYDENHYAATVDAERRHMKDLLTEFSTLRHSSMQMFAAFTKDELLRSGVASGHNVSVRALGFMLIGHQNHHMKVFQERYLDGESL